MRQEVGCGRGGGGAGRWLGRGGAGGWLQWGWLVMGGEVRQLSGLLVVTYIPGVESVCQCVYLSVCQQNEEQKKLAAAKKRERKKRQKEKKKAKLVKYRLIRCASQNTETVIQTFRQPTAAFISDDDAFTDESSRRLLKRLNYCFSVLAIATNRSI